MPSREPERQEAGCLSIVTPLGAEAFKLVRLTFSEALSSPFTLVADVFSNCERVEDSALLGRPLLCRLKHGEGERLFHGVVMAVRRGGKRDGRESADDARRDFRLIAEPVLSRLKHRHNCRIYQGQSVVEMVSGLLREHGQAHSQRLRRRYPPRDYCVQYQESDFAFVHRLLQDEGLFYFFEHGEEGHRLVLVDDATGYVPCAESRLGCSAGPLAVAPLRHWRVTSRLTAGRASTRGYNFVQPESPPATQVERRPLGPVQAGLEIYRYQGGSQWQQRLPWRTELDLETSQQPLSSASGGGSSRRLAAGHYFDREGPDGRREPGPGYALSRVLLQVVDNHQSGARGASPHIDCRFECVPRNLTYRSRAWCDKPRLAGVQTARVTGGPGEELHVDRYGRVKIQFHWDRQGRHDPGSSGWVRVAHNWAGERWGSYFHPRVGQEVVVAFLEGDPDQPLIIGALYNGSHMPPYELPRHQTRSGLKSRSSKGAEADCYNELRFEDASGEELLLLQAQRDHWLRVKHDQSDHIDHDRRTRIGHSDHTQVGQDLQLEAGHQTVLRSGGASITLKSDGSIIIAGADVTITGDLISLKAGKLSLN